jgi:hypothetical protein
MPAAGERGSWKLMVEVKGTREGTDLLVEVTSELIHKAQTDTRHQAHRRMDYRL